VTATLKKTISEHFGVVDIPEGYLYFPSSIGGLDLKSPFINLYIIRDWITDNPDYHMDLFFENKEAEYRKLKSIFEAGKVPGQTDLPIQSERSA